jgi:hypothetical protein
MAKAAARPEAPMPASVFLERARTLALPPVVVLAGAERWFREQAVAAIAARVFPDGDPGGAFTRLNARDPAQRDAVAGAVEELRGGSLFGTGRVVVVEHPEAAGGAGGAAAADAEAADDPEDGAEADDETRSGSGAPPAGRAKSPLLGFALPALEAAVAGSVLVLSTARPVKGKGAVPLVTLQKKGALVVDCRPLYDAPGPWDRGAERHEHDLARHLARRMKARHGKTLALPEAHALTQRVGSDLGDLEQALESLALYAGERGSVAAADLDACFTGTREDPVWRLVDAVLDGRLADALDRVENALAGGLADARGVPVTRPEALVPLVTAALHAAFRRVLAGAEALARGEDGGAVVRAAGLPPFLGEAHLARCRRDPAAWLDRHAAFLEAERGVRGGGVPPDLALERLVLALAAPGGRGVPAGA